MLNYIVPLVESWLPVFNEYLVPLLCCVVIAFVPALVYSLFRG